LKKGSLKLKPKPIESRFIKLRKNIQKDKGNPAWVVAAYTLPSFISSS
jgi:hypothetical protein